jgi:GTP1/Obg family GTP-binding protein
MFHKELSKIGKDLHKLSKKIKKLSKTVAKKEAKVKQKIKKLPNVKQKLTGAGIEKPRIQRVLDVIQASEQGLDPKAIKHLTGLPKEKVHKILHQLFKDGKIMIESGGLYTGVKRGSRNS